MGDILLAVVLSIMLSRALSRLMSGIKEGLSGRQASGTPERGVQMERDPVCGTFVVPSNALTMLDGRRRVYFCSLACRDAYRARTA
jgi:hypothetical protein